MDWEKLIVQVLVGGFLVICRIKGTWPFGEEGLICTTMVPYQDTMILRNLWILIGGC